MRLLEWDEGVATTPERLHPREVEETRGRLVLVGTVEEVRGTVERHDDS